MARGGLYRRLMRDVFDIPEDETGAAARLTLVGRRRLTLSGAHRLVVCDGDGALFATAGGMLRIKGAGLRAEQMDADETVLTGRVDELSFIADAQKDAAKGRETR